MSIRFFWIMACSAAISLGIGAEARADGIDATSSNSYAEADDGISNATQTLSNPPIDLTTTASVGAASSKTVTTVTSSDIDFDAFWTTADDGDSYAISEGFVDFTADGSWSYELSGSVDFGGGDGTPLMILLLFDLTNNKILFYDDGSTDISGETGLFVNGNDYRFYFYGSIANDDAVGLEGGGGALLELVQEVPEPGTLALLGLGLGGFVILRRRRTAA